MGEKKAPRVDPERLAHFRVLGRLGQGGMGVVYRAEDEKLRRQVALKVLPEALAKDEDRRRRFLREARSAAAITHPKQTNDVFPQWMFSWELVTLTEAGQTDRALAVADAEMKRMPALARETSAQGRDDVLRVRRRSGHVPDAEFRADREAWAKDAMPRQAPNFVNNVWFDFYAAPAASPLDAREALDALVRFSPLPPYEGLAYQEGVMGHVLLLAGRVDEAVPHLRRAITMCLDPGSMFWHQWAAEELGEALEAKGDKDGACEAFDEVLAHWGNARPRSVTADKSRAHMKPLGCAR